MKAKKWLIFMVLFALMMAFAVGCGAGDTPLPGNGEEEEESEEEGDANGRSPMAVYLSATEFRIV